MSLSSNVTALATRIGQEIKAVRTEITSALSGYVPTTRTVSAGTGLSGGGDLSANRSLAVSYGTTAGTAAQGNDARLSDARTPTAHVHAGADISSGTVAYARLPVGTAASTVAAGNDARFTDARTPTAHVHAGADISSGTLDAARLPVVLSPVRAVAYSATPTVDPTVSGTNVSITATGNITTLAVSTTGAVNRQALEIAVLGSGGARTVTFATAIRTSTGITRGPHTIASGEVGIFLVRYYSLVSAWVLVAATVSAT
mgnify:CR=1 FL=1